MKFIGLDILGPGFIQSQCHSSLYSRTYRVGVWKYWLDLVPHFANTPLLIFFILISVVLDFFALFTHFWIFYLRFYIQFYSDFPATHPIPHFERFFQLWFAEHTPLYTSLWDFPFERFYCIWNAMEVNLFRAFDNILVQLVLIIYLVTRMEYQRKLALLCIHLVSYGDEILVIYLQI